MSGFYYRVFGLNIQCPFECPLLQPSSGEMDVIIEFGQISRDLIDSETQFLLTIKGVATYLIEHGNKIIIETIIQTHNKIK